MKTSYIHKGVFISMVSILARSTASLTESEFEQRFAKDVATPFNASIKHYHSILAHLSKLVALNEAGGGIPPEISPELKASIRNFVSKIKKVSSNSHSLEDNTSKSVEERTNQISETDHKIQEKKKNINTNKERVKGQERMSLQAAKGLKMALENLKTYKEVLREAKVRLHNARYNCVKRRKKRSWNSWWNYDFPGAWCTLGNVFSKSIDNAYGDYTKAWDQIGPARSLLERRQKELTAAKNGLRDLEAEQRDLKFQRASLQNKVISLKERRDKMQSIDQKIKTAVTFIDKMKSSASSVKSVVKLGYLIDAQNLVEPLMDIGSAMKDIIGGSGNVFPKPLREKIKQLSSKLKQLHKK